MIDHEVRSVVFINLCRSCPPLGVANLPRTCLRELLEETHGNSNVAEVILQIRPEYPTQVFTVFHPKPDNPPSLKVLNCRFWQISRTTPFFTSVACRAPNVFPLLSLACTWCIVFLGMSWLLIIVMT